MNRCPLYNVRMCQELFQQQAESSRLTLKISRGVSADWMGSSRDERVMGRGSEKPLSQALRIFLLITSMSLLVQRSETALKLIRCWGGERRVKGVKNAYDVTSFALDCVFWCKSANLNNFLLPMSQAKKFEYFLSLP